MINFRKISAILTSTALVGMTMGVAAAANYPAPFVTGGSANAAVVYGTGVGVSPLDAVQASSIKDSLTTYVDDDDTSDDTTTGGDSVKLERSSDKVNLGDDVATVFATSVTDEDLEELLAEGTYADDDNNEFDFTQKVTLGTGLDVTHFSDTDYDDLIDASDETPTVGIQYAGSVHVLNYTLDFTTHPLYGADTLETTTLNLLGREYYVLDVTNDTNKTTLLDSATSALLTEGESQTLTLGDKSYETTINFIGTSSVKLTVNGDTTTSLAAGGTYKLSDGTYVGVKEILYTSKDSGLSKVEFSLGTGKLELTDEAQIELNDETIEEITSFIEQDSSEKLDKLVLMWTTDDEEFITPEAEMIMPGFEALKLQMSDHTMDVEEETTIEGGSTYIQIKTTLKDGDVTIPILYSNSTGEFAGFGKDSSNLLMTTNKTANSDTTIQFNETASHKYFVASWNSTSEAESYYLKADVTTEDSVDKVRFTNQADGTEKTVTNGSTVTFGSITITIWNITRVGGVDEYFNMTLNSGGSFNTLYTKEGLKIYLPWLATNSTTTPGAINISNPTLLGNTTTGYNYDSYYLFLENENKDGNIGAGDMFNVTLDESGTTNKVHVQTVSADRSGYEIGSTDDYEYYQVDDMATKIVHDTGGDYDSVVVTYHGEQFSVNLYLSAPETSIGPGTPGTSGVLLVRDSEVASVKSKNLVVVGGSCINTAAAALVGGAYCGSAWTTATDVGMGEFLIKSYSGSTLTDAGKIALLVAGYEAQDTVNAATYLTTKTVDTSAHYVGTSSTEATLVVA